MNLDKESIDRMSLLEVADSLVEVGKLLGSSVSLVSCTNFFRAKELLTQRLLSLAGGSSVSLSGKKS